MRLLSSVAVACLLSACDGSSSTSGSAPTTTPLEAALSNCAQGQQSVLEALQGTDQGHVLRTLDTAQTACKSAAAELRQTPLPSLDPVKGPAALDTLAAGLGQIKAAVPLLNRSPARARQLAQRGMHTYQAGLAQLDAAKQN